MVSVGNGFLMIILSALPKSGVDEVILSMVYVKLTAPWFRVTVVGAIFAWASSAWEIPAVKFESISLAFSARL